MVVLTIVYIIVAAAFAAAFPALRIGALHTGWAQDLGAALLIVAAVLYVPVITAVRQAAERGRLLTGGIFALRARTPSTRRSSSSSARAWR